MKGWDPQQYLRFRRERAQPFYDLVDLIASRQRMRVVDLGCGAGGLTGVLHERLGAGRTTGLDSSTDMLREARTVSLTGVDFEHRDIEDFADDAGGERFDLVFSNAALHWLPDHPRLFERLSARLTDVGQLAVQMPDNFGYHTHTTARAVAERPEFADHLESVRAPSVLRPEEYAEVLHRLGFRTQTVRLAVYPHVLPTRQHAVAWAQGSILTPYRARLTDDEYAAFEKVYSETLFAAIGADKDDEPIFFPYRRLLIVARR